MAFSFSRVVARLDIARGRVAKTFATIVSFTLLPVLAGLVPTQARAQTTTIPAQGGWCASISGVGCEYYPSADAACSRSHQFYAPTETYLGYKDTATYWINKKCEWTTKPGTILPSIDYWVCPPSKTALMPGRCVEDDFLTRPEQKCSTGGSPATPHPIDILTGSKQFSVMDFATADNALKLTRLYNSAPYGAAGNSLYSLPRGLANWQFSFGLELQITDDIMYYDRLVLAAPDGGTYAFQKQSSGDLTPYRPVARPQQQVRYTLEKIGAWPSLSTLANSKTYWKVVDDDDNVWTLESYIDPATTKYTRAMVTQIVSREGLTLTFTRATDGELTSLTDSYGKTITFDWLTGSIGELLAITAAHLPGGYTINYVYDSATEPTALVRVEHLDAGSVLQDQTTYVYGDGRFPTAVTDVLDKNGVTRWSVTYDSEFRATSSYGPGGADGSTVAYSPQGTSFSRTVTNALGKDTVYNYSRPYTFEYNQNLVGVTGVASTNCPASSQSTTYGGDKFLSSATDEEGRVTTYTWDSRGLPTQVVEASGDPEARTTTATWDATFHVPTQVVKDGLTTDFVYDLQGRVTSKTLTDTTLITVPYSTNGRTKTWSYTWSGTGQLLTIDGPLSGSGDTITYTYDVNGFLNTVTDQVGSVTTISSVDWRGAPLTVVDQNGISTTLTYDINGRLLTATINPGGSQSLYQFAYTAMGDVSQITMPGGGWLQYTYNAARQVTLVTNDRGETQTITRDLLGNALSRTTKNSGATITREQTAAYDELGRLIKVIGTAGAPTQETEIGYDKVSNLTSVTNPLSKVRLTAFDGLNRVITETDPESRTNDYAYNARDGVTQFTDGNGFDTDLVVDGFGMTIQETSPDRGVRTYWYDAANNLTKIVDGDSEETIYAYDAAGRRTSATYTGAPVETVTYTYDSTAGGNYGVGRLTGVTEESGSTAYTYDAQGMITTDAKVIQGRSYAVNYAYDVNGKVTQITYPSGRIVDVARATDGLATGVTMKASSLASPVNVATSIAYQPFGPVKDLTYGNGLTLARTFDGNYWMTGTRVASGGTVRLDLGFQWYDDGRLGEVNDNIGARTTYIAYSDAGRLSYADGPWGTHNYFYDGAGNRVEKSATVGGVTTTEYAIGSGTNNRITQIQDVSTTPIRNLSYRAGGDLHQDQAVSGPLFQFNYNARKRLVNVEKNSVSVASYGYDFLGRRVWRETFGVGASETQYIFDRDGHLLAEHDSNTGAVIKEYVWLDDMPLAMVDASAGPAQTYYIHAGHLEEPLVLTNSGQAVVWDAYVEPYGTAATFSSPTASIALRLPGQWVQFEANGLHQNGWRDYDPSLGRYIQADPLGLNAGQNVYAYVNGDPLNWTDPTGEMPLIVAGALIGGGLSGGFEAVSQYRQHGTDFRSWDYKAIAVSTGSGAVTGALMTTPLGYTRWGVAGIGAFGGLINGVFQDCPTAESIGTNIVFGALGGAIGGKFVSKRPGRRPLPIHVDDPRLVWDLLLPNSFLETSQLIGGQYVQTFGPSGAEEAGY